MKNLGIYYGWLNALNSATHAWSNEAVARDLARYHLLVLGDGVQESAHGDYTNTKVILPRIKELNPNCVFYGYVTVNQTYDNFVAKVKEWQILGVEGIFFDEAGYDFGTVATNSRSAFNEKVRFVKAADMFCFINAWNPDHVLGIENDVSYPNPTWNPGLLDSPLDESDYLLLESFGITSLGTFETPTAWFARGEKALEMREEYGIQLAGSSVIPDGHEDEVERMQFLSVSAAMWDLDALGTSDENYGASSAKMKLVARPDMRGLELGDSAVVFLETNKYACYGENGMVNIDFASGAESSSILFY